MKNNEYNKNPSSELNNTNSFEYGGNSNNDRIINNSENNLNSNYDSKVNEFGEDLGSQKTNDSNLDLKDLQSGGEEAGAASRASTISVSSAATIATTAIVAIVGGITVMTTTVTTNVDVEIASIVASYNSIDYDIWATGDTSSLQLTIKNDFEAYTVDLTEGQNVGKAENLKSNMDYTITITYDDFLSKTTAFKGVITTLSAKDYVTDPSTFKLDYLCQCGVDGFFYFTMDFRDDYKYWYDFEATLTDSEGHVSACVFTNDLFEVQKIKVVNYDGNDNDLIGEEATLKIECNTKQSEGKLVLYNEVVEI